MDPYIVILVVLFTGMVAGFIGGYGGIGGGFIMVFMLTTLLSFSQQHAQGTALATLMGPISLMGVLALRKEVMRFLKEILIAVIAFAIFSYLGAATAYLFSTSGLELVFNTFLILVGLYYIASTKYSLELKRVHKFTPFTMIWVGALAGFLGGLVGIGGGIVFVSILCIVYGFNKNEARAISLATLLPPVSLGAVVKYSGQGDIDWYLAAILFSGFFVMNYFGTRLANNHSSGQFKFYFGLLMIATGVINLYLLNC